jgi:NitT/TauT family transport system substrate-binding protein
MRRREVFRRVALRILAGALAAPVVVRAQQARELRAIIQYGVSYLPFMLIEGEHLQEAALVDQGNAPMELKIQRVSGSIAVNDGLLAGMADVGVMGVTSLLIINEKSRGAVKALAGCVLDSVANRIRSLLDFTLHDRIAPPATTSPRRSACEWRPKKGSVAQKA